MKAILVKSENGLRGSTADDHLAWARFKKRLERMKPGTFLRLEWAVPRSGKQHRKMFALLTLIKDNSETYDTVEKALVAVKLAAGYFDPHVDPTTGEVVPVVHSIAYESMCQDEFEKFYANAISAVCDCIVPQLDVETAQRLIDVIIEGWG